MKGLKKVLLECSKDFIDLALSERPLKSKFSWDKSKEEEFSKVPVKTLVEDEYFLGQKDYIYSCHLEDLIELWDRKNKGEIDTFIDIEAIGAGKTFKAADILWLQAYEYLTKLNPQEYYGLAPKSRIAEICMSRNVGKAKAVTFTEVLMKFDCPFFRDYFPPSISFQKMRESQRYPQYLKFPKNFAIFPGSGSQLSALGFNLLSAVIDEANFLEYVEDSKRSSGHTYDASKEIFDAIYNRMVSRFLESDKPITKGIIVVISSPRFEGDFLSRKKEEAKINSRIMVKERSLWEAKPHKFSGTYLKFDLDSLRFLSPE